MTNQTKIQARNTTHCATVMFSRNERSSSSEYAESAIRSIQSFIACAEKFPKIDISAFLDQLDERQKKLSSRTAGQRKFHVFFFPSLDWGTRARSKHLYPAIRQIGERLTIKFRGTSRRYHQAEQNNHAWPRQNALLRSVQTRLLLTDELQIFTINPVSNASFSHSSSPGDRAANRFPAYPRGFATTRVPATS